MSEEVLKQMSIEQLQEALIDLSHQAEKTLPSVEELDGWIPFQATREGVLACQYTDDKKELINYETFKPEGKWKDIYDYFMVRDAILTRLEKEVRKVDGSSMLVPEDMEDHGDVDGVTQEGSGFLSGKQDTGSHMTMLTSTSQTLGKRTLKQ